MKKPIQSLVAIAAFGFIALAAQAQPAFKLLVVDMAKLYDTYYKTLGENAKLQTDEEAAKTELAKLGAERQTIVDEYKALVEQGNNPALSADAKTKAQGEAQKKIPAIQKKEQDMQQFAQDVRTQLQQRFQNIRSLMLDELSKVAADIAKRKGATLLVDKSGPTVFGISNVIYTDPAYDITDEVMKEANKDKPANSPTAPAPGAAAPAGSDISAPPPALSVPNITPKKQ